MVEEQIPKINQYVKTKRGFIGQIVHIQEHPDNNLPTEYYLDCMKIISLDAIEDIKDSIGELIKVGDYINGHLVFDIKNDEGKLEFGIEDSNLLNHYITEDQINFINTKKRFMINKYNIYHSIINKDTIRQI